MMMPPTRPSVFEIRERHRSRLETLLEQIERRIELLELARENPLAWLALGSAAIILEIPLPHEELERLYCAAAFLEAALMFYEGRK